MPMEPRRALSAPATPMPATSPTTEATAPTTTDSRITDASTCRRLAPMARINAISLLRWATMIEKEL